MTNSILNLFGSLSQASYDSGEQNFAWDEAHFWDGIKKNDQSPIEEDFSNTTDFDGVQHDNLLQPDTNKNAPLTDDKAGFNAYFLTDTQQLNRDTKNTYFVTRGSDKPGWDSMNDWLSNDIDFALTDDYIPQAKLANIAMKSELKEMAQKSPNASMTVTGHSLGTIASIQAVANLSKDEVNKIDHVVLFNGPDASTSIDKMSKQTQQNIRKLDGEGKIDYYLNPFDPVSTLNRNQSGVDEVGNTHYIIPTKISVQPFDNHSLGKMQTDENGNIIEATIKDTPEYFAAGIRVSNLTNKYLKKIKDKFPEVVLTGGELLLVLSNPFDPKNAVILLDAGLTVQDILELKNEYESDYKKIITEVNGDLNWDNYVSVKQDQIKNSSGAEKISLREDLARNTAVMAFRYAEDYQTIYDSSIQETEDEVDQIVNDTKSGAAAIQKYLSNSEVDALIADLTKANTWSTSQKSADDRAIKKAKNAIEDFSTELSTVSENMVKFDGDAGKTIFTPFDTKKVKEGLFGGK